MNKPLWKPSRSRIAGTRLAAFMQEAEDRWGRELDGYEGLHRWSVDQPGQFWTSLWDEAGLVARTRGGRVVEEGERMPGAKWFPDARLNFAENLLQGQMDRQDEGPALVFW